MIQKTNPWSRAGSPSRMPAAGPDLESRWFGHPLRSRRRTPSTPPDPAPFEQRRPALAPHPGRGEAGRRMLDQSPDTGNDPDHGPVMVVKPSTTPSGSETTMTTYRQQIEQFDAPTAAVEDISGDYTIDPTHTRIGFSTRHAMVTTVRGQFTEFSGTAHVDAADPAASRVELAIQTASIDTGVADRDAHLRSADFFNADENKEIRFVPRRSSATATTG